jgi:hypothetical protein
VAYVNSSDPAGLLQQCAGSGLTSAPVNITFQTTPDDQRVTGSSSQESGWFADVRRGLTYGPARP